MSSGKDYTELPEILECVPEGELLPESRDLYAHIIATGQYDAPSRILVINFLQQRETAILARKHVAEEGRVFKDRWGQPRQNPWAKEEREAVAAMSRLYRSLGWDQAPPDSQLNLFAMGGRNAPR